MNSKGKMNKTQVFFFVMSCITLTNKHERVKPKTISVVNRLCIVDNFFVEFLAFGRYLLQ